MSRYTRDSEHTSTSWYSSGWSPSTNKHQTNKSSYSGWSKRCTRGNPSEYEGRHSYWDDGEAQDSANDTEGVAVEGKEKTHRKEKETEEDGVIVRDTNENASEQERAKDSWQQKETVGIAPSPQQSERSLSCTYKKNNDANAKVYDLNQKTMQALDALAEEYEIFKETLKKVTHDTQEGDMLFSVAYEAMEELDKAQKDHDRLQRAWSPPPRSPPTVGPFTMLRAQT